MDSVSNRRRLIFPLLLITSFVNLLSQRSAAFAGTITNGIENAVVKVFSSVVYPDPYKPWSKRSPTEIAGSGMVIAGKRILSNAHLVLYARQVLVQANQSGEKVSATVEAIAPGIDLAVLKLDDESFFDSHPVLPFSKNLPNIKDAITVYGYPEGGNGLSITKGIVSRIEFVGYNPPVSGLRIQIDAAINHGNSGGPAIVGDKLVGVAFSRLDEAQNIGYIIPTEEVELFLEGLANGRYEGKPDLYNSLQNLQNPSLRKYLGVDNSIHGVIVNNPESTNDTYSLKEWDVITKIGETPVDDEGMINLDGNLRVRFDYLVQKIAKQGKIPLTVMRAGKQVKLEVPVTLNPSTVIPGLDGNYPSYFIYGTAVFTTLTKEYFTGLWAASKGAWLLGNPLASRLHDKPSFEGESFVVVACPFFAHKLSKGYSDPTGQVVQSINGIAIKNLAHLVEVLRDAKGEFIAIQYMGHNKEKQVFPRAEMIAATAEILSDNGIRSQGSENLLTIWNENPPR